MSQAALCLAARDRIRTVLSLDATTCRFVMDPQGKPPAFAGEQFVSVHPGEWRGNDQAESGLDEDFGFCVTVTRKLGSTPADQWGEEVWAKAATGLEVVLRRILVALHKDRASDALRNAANDYIDDSLNGFVTSPVFRGGGLPTPRGHDWLSSGTTQRGQLTADPAVSQTLTFGGAKRLQETVTAG